MAESRGGNVAVLTTATTAVVLAVLDGVSRLQTAEQLIPQKLRAYLPPLYIAAFAVALLILRHESRPVSGNGNVDVDTALHLGVTVDNQQKVFQFENFGDDPAFSATAQVSFGSTSHLEFRADRPVLRGKPVAAFVYQVFGDRRELVHSYDLASVLRKADIAVGRDCDAIDNGRRHVMAAMGAFDGDFDVTTEFIDKHRHTHRQECSHKLILERSPDAKNIRIRFEPVPVSATPHEPLAIDPSSIQELKNAIRDAVPTDVTLHHSEVRGPPSVFDVPSIVIAYRGEWDEDPAETEQAYFFEYLSFRNIGPVAAANVTLLPLNIMGRSIEIKPVSALVPNEPAIERQVLGLSNALMMVRRKMPPPPRGERATPIRIKLTIDAGMWAQHEGLRWEYALTADGFGEITIQRVNPNASPIAWTDLAALDGA